MLVFMGPYDAMENGGARFWLFYYQSFFSSHISVIYSDMKVLLLAVYFFFPYKH